MDYIKQFSNRYPYSAVQYHAPLQCSMRVGGAVDILITPGQELEILAAVRLCRELSIPYHIAGNLSNTLVCDRGYAGAVIQLGSEYAGYSVSEEGIAVKSGTSLIKLAKELTEMGYGGLEFAGGIPGTVGGGIYMNAGAYGGQMSDLVTALKVFDGKHVSILSYEQLEFSYRRSVLMKMPGAVILEGQFKPQKGKADKGALVEYNRKRAQSQPLELPNCGSTFRRPVDGYAAVLIEECGLVGLSIGDAQVSCKHSGFIVNNGNATAGEVLALMRKVQQEVRLQKGVALEPEWVILGEQG